MGTDNVIKKPPKAEKLYLGKIPEIIGGAIGIFLGYKLGIVGLLILAAILGIPLLLGFKYASWYVKRPKPNIGWIEFISWANVLTWILPPLGMLTAGITFGLNKHNLNSKRKYYILAGIGLGAALVNGAVGTYLRYKSQKGL